MRARSRRQGRDHNATTTIDTLGGFRTPARRGCRGGDNPGPSRLLKNSFANGLEGRFVSEVVGELDVDGAVIL
jgi:hypothetical protein